MLLTVQTLNPGLRRFQFAALVAWVAGAGATGCTAIAERPFSTIEHEIRAVDGDLALFRQCLESRGGACQGNTATSLPQTVAIGGRVASLRAGLSAPVATAVATLGPDHPAQTASAVLSHPFLKKIVAVHNQLRGLPSSEPVQGVGVTSTEEAGASTTTLALTLSPEEVGDFMDQAHLATASGAWRALAEQAQAQASALSPQAGAGFAEAQQDARTAAFIHRYTEAYFENGKFVKIDLDPQDLETKAESFLAQNASLFCGSPSQAKEFCDPLVSSLQGEILQGVAKDPSNQDFVLLALGTRGYVSRTGQSFAFPGLSITLEPAGGQPVSAAKIDLTQVGTELTWVFFQALFDAHEGLPAVSSATGVSLGPTDQAFDLPVFNPGTGNVDEKDFQDIVTFSNQVGGAVGAAFDKAIRGLGPFSLNNEALEDLLTAIVTVTVNDAAQKAAWCWYSCNLDQQIDTAAANEKERIRSDLRRRAKRIKLKLRIVEKP